MSAARRRCSVACRAAASDDAPVALVVDHDPIFRSLVIALLEGTCEAREASDPLEAARLCQRYVPEVLVTRRRMAVPLRDLLAGLLSEALGDRPPCFIVVTDEESGRAEHADVAAMVSRDRLAEDLPETVARIIDAQKRGRH